MLLRRLNLAKSVKAVFNMSRAFSSRNDHQFTGEQRAFFEENGYAILEDFFSHDQVDQIKAEMGNIIQDGSEEAEAQKAVFTTKNQVQKISNTLDYFLDSGDKIRFFYENDAFDEDGNLAMPIEEALNKVGHNMHDLNPVFENFCYQNDVKRIANEIIGYKAPIITQSMYIFKNPRVGGEVLPHIDNTYVRSNPLSCNGIWVALDDAGEDNGAMYGVPGSHKKVVPNYFMRRRQKETTDESGNTILENELYYEPSEEPTYDLSNAVAMPAKKGTAVLLHGSFVHFSHHNHSEKPRHAFTMHLVEGRDTKWEPDCWLQRADDKPFRLMNKVEL